MRDRRQLGVGALVLAAVAAATLGAAHVVGGGVPETWTAVTNPDLLAEPRAFAGVVASAAVVAGGIALALALVVSLRRPGRSVDGELVDARIERSLARARLAELEGHVVACGVEDVVRTLADELGRRGVATVVVESDAARAERARLFLAYVVEGDARRGDTLLAAGVARAAAVALCGLPERERARVARAAGEADPGIGIAAVHDAAGAQLFAEALVSGATGRAARPAS